jgi:hypothetical protein
MVRVIPVLVVVCCIGAAPATEKRAYRLGAARISQGRGQNLLIKLVPIDGKGPDVTLAFPAHSFTPHERELQKAVLAAVPLDESNGHNDWALARKQVYFWLPEERPSMAKEWWDGVRVIEETKASQQIGGAGGDQ